MQLSIIIVNYNVKHFLEQCLFSVLKACTNISAEIIVIDNNSADGSKELLPAAFPQVSFIWNTVNTGFAKANNQALAIAKGEYILFLNPDTIVPEDCFEKCLAFFKQHNNAGALGIRMIDGSGKFLKESKRAFPSPRTSLYKLSGLAKLFPQSKIFAKYHLGNLSETENHPVDVLAGAFMMLPKTVLTQVGSFDETFFMYGEDVDLSYRVQKATCAATGNTYNNYYFAESTIIHFKGESTKKGSLNYVRLFYSAMSLFVKKHYSGSRATLFNILIQGGILIRAFVAYTAKFLQRIGLPLLDAAIIFMSFWGIKLLWNTYIRNDVNYSPNMLITAFPIFTVIFLIASYYAGLYDRGYKQTQLNHSVAIAAVVLISGYALLPESIRFSRGILVFGIIMAFTLMSLLRWLLVQWHLLAADADEEESPQTIVVASASDFKTVNILLQQAGMPERVLGRIEKNINHTTTPALGNIQQLQHIISTYPVKEIIFCQDGLSFKEIITQIQLLPGHVKNKFHASGSSSIVGSHSKDVSGNFVAAEKKYTIASPLNRRNKNLLDAAVAVLLLVSFPVHLFTQKKPGQFFKNLFAVLLMQKTWVGYAVKNNLPAIKKGIITSTSLPVALNDLPAESLLLSDEWYATGYKPHTDIKKIVRGYRYLCY